MRIAFIVNEFPVISETFILDQVTGLIDRGCEVDIYTAEMHGHTRSHSDVHAYDLLQRVFLTRPPPVASKAGRLALGARDVVRSLMIAPRRVAQSLNPLRHGLPALKLQPFYKLAGFLAKRSYDVVHAHFGPNGLLATELRALRATSAPLVTQFHGYDATEYVRQNGPDVYSRLFAEGDLFLCVSQRIVQLLRELGCAESKLVVHHTGVDVAKVPFSARFERPSATLKLVTVSRLVEKKGLEYALRAFSLLVPEFPDARLRVIGDGPERARLTALAHELGIQALVDFAGALPRNEVASAMREADALLAPSVSARSGDEEGIPVVLMEALASGLPVVSTRHAGIPELIEHGVSGLLAAERDYAGLAEHVRYLATNHAQRNAMCRAARSVVERDYDVNRLNTTLLERYRELAERRRSAPPSPG